MRAHIQLTPGCQMRPAISVAWTSNEPSTDETDRLVVVFIHWSCGMINKAQRDGVLP